MGGKARYQSGLFAGAHSNVGGGYPKDALAYVTLDWMVEEMDDVARKDGITGLQLLPGRKDEFRYGANAYGRQYEPRSGGRFFYRYSPRVLVRLYRGTDGFWSRTGRWVTGRVGPGSKAEDETINIHDSVWQRIQRRTQNYAPNGLPPAGSATTLRMVSTVRPGHGRAEADFPRLSRQDTDKIRLVIRTRQGLYVLMIVFLLALVALGLLTAGPPQPTDGIASTIASGLAALAKFVLPDFAGPFVSRMFGNVAWSLTCSAGFLISAVLSLYWKKRINDTTRLAWNSVIRHQDGASTPAVD